MRTQSQAADQLLRNGGLSGPMTATNEVHLIMEKTGGAFLLQETTATKLVGSLMSGVGVDGVGWIHLSFFPDAEQLSLVRRDDRMTCKMSRAIGMSLISLLQVLLAQIQWLREKSPEPLVVDGRERGREWSIHIERQSILCSWADDEPSASIVGTDESIEVRMIEPFVRELVAELVSELGRFAAAVQPPDASSRRVP